MTDSECSILSDSDVDFIQDEDDDSDFDDFERENITPISSKSTKKSKPVVKKAAKKKNTSPACDNNVVKVLGERSGNKDNCQNSEVSTEKKNSKGGKSKTVEQIYQKKTQLEHILLRPDTYVGSVERITQGMYVLDGEEIVEKQVTYTPGLYKIYDEILVNAADNKQRDNTMDKLDICINPEENIISVKNNGKGIPVVMHKEHNCYVPTLIFGHLLTGSNFDDDEKKTTGGRNGYGAKLANIFSQMFSVECADSNAGLKFAQTFRENMTITEEPKIKKLTAAEKKRGDYVKISFSPDLKRFKMDSLDEDTVSLLSKRAYDIAGSMSSAPGKKLSVTLNSKKLAVRNFQAYLKLYRGIEPPAAYEKSGERWEVGASVSDGSPQQISFVNSICTSKGGQHVNYIADQVAKRIAAAVNKKNKGGVAIKESQMKNHLCIFVNCLIENPAFDSQTKENMTTRKNAFGSKCDLSDKFMKDVEKSGVVDRILAFAKFKQTQALQKKGGTKKIKLTGIVKLDDANNAGSAKSKDCTLILTEGDSAKSLAMSGLSIVGRDFYGVFPLKGKPLNVREASHKQIMGNAEIKNIVDIMGLKFGVEYDESNIKTLRYGHLMIMADQDHDGSHIKGLVINFIHVFWPSLLEIKGFLQQFITPIVKATKGKKNHTFFTVPEYEIWKESTGNDAKGWNVKYYKGLGTSTSAEAKDYFSHLDLHEIVFEDISNDIHNESPGSGDEMDNSEAVPDKVVSGSNLINMAFGKKNVEDRKVWLNNIKKDTYLDYSEAQSKGVTYSDFINKELILFSQADNQRSIPHVFDGFKPSQRKVLFACFLKNLKSEMKVAQLCGYVGEKSAYHHGEASLAGTIVGMAQDFVGSNNVNLLTPAGQFGTRRMGGKDAASPRYIFTKLEKITRTIFHPDDDALLNYLTDDGQQIEPAFYMPVIPMVLVNGSEGIGTGWSTNVPNFCPRQIISNIRRLIDGKEMEKMEPQYYGYTGKIEADNKKSQTYNVIGKVDRKDDTTLHISELPLKKWTQDYKVFLEGMITSDGKKEAELKDFKENHTDSTVAFTVVATKEKIDEFENGKDGLYGKFKLTSIIHASNMNLFDEHGKIVKYESPEKILEYFCSVRSQYYSDRKENLLRILRRDQSMLSNRARFVEEVCSGDLIVSNRKRKDLLWDLKEREYDLLPKEKNQSKPKDDDSGDESDTDENENEAEADLAKGYEYLLGMKIWSLTFEKAEKLRNELAEKTIEVEELEATAPTQIWKNDLDALEAALDDRDIAYAASADAELKAQAQSKSRKNQSTKRNKAPRGRKPKKINKIGSDDDDDDDDEDFMVENVKSKKKAPPKIKANQKRPKRGKKVDKDIDMEVEIVEKKLSPLSSDSQVVEIDPDSEPEALALSDRLRHTLAISPAPKKAADDNTSSPQSSTDEIGRKRSSQTARESGSSLDSFDTKSFEPATLTPAPKRMKKGNKKEAKEDSNETSDKDTGPTKKTTKRSTKPNGKKKATKKKEVEDLVSSDDDLFDEDISVCKEKSKPLPARSRSTRGRGAAVKYVESDTESDNNSVFESNDDSDDESDF